MGYLNYAFGPLTCLEACLLEIETYFVPNFSLEQQTKMQIFNYYSLN